MKYNVFIDTCIYKSMRYQFNNNHSLTMDLLKSQIDMNKIQILMPIIIKKEIESHLNPNEEDILTNINNAIKNATKDYSWMLEKNYEFLTSSMINRTKNREFEEFIKTYKCKILPYSYININNVFEAYFNNKFPFENNNKKKNEFPDAFCVDIVKNYLKNNLENLIVITTDVGVKNAFSSDVVVLSSINQLLSFLNSNVDSNNDINLHLKRIDVVKSEEIINKIQKDMDNLKCQITNIIGIKNLDLINFENIYATDVSNYQLIGKKDDIIYVSANAYYNARLSYYKRTLLNNQSSEEMNNDETKKCDYYYDGNLTYNLEIKVNGIDDYEVLKVNNTLYQNIINIDYEKLITYFMLF